MCEAGVPEKLDSPGWTNRDGKNCPPSEVFNYKVTDHINYLDMCIVGDEVGGNSSQKCDHHISEILHVYERNFTY